MSLKPLPSRSLQELFCLTTCFKKNCKEVAGLLEQLKRILKELLREEKKKKKKEKKWCDFVKGCSHIPQLLVII